MKWLNILKRKKITKTEITYKNDLAVDSSLYNVKIKNIKTVIINIKKDE